MTYPASPTKILFNGDSLCIGLAETGSWSTRIAEWLGIPCYNYARGGGTITENPPPLKSGPARHSVSATLAKMHEEHPDADYILIEGGANDADLLGDAAAGEESRIGTLDPYDYSGNYDRDTFTGALESIFYRATSLWNGAHIGYIVPQKLGLNELAMKRFRYYFDRAIAVCRKWGIPYLDLWETCFMTPMLPHMRDPEKTAEEMKRENVTYYYDSGHMTARGYDVTSDRIFKWLKTF